MCIRDRIDIEHRGKSIAYYGCNASQLCCHHTSTTRIYSPPSAIPRLEERAPLIIWSVIVCMWHACIFQQKWYNKKKHQILYILNSHLFIPLHWRKYSSIWKNNKRNENQRRDKTSEFWTPKIKGNWFVFSLELEF